MTTKETHIMLDIETMGTGRDAKVIAVGAAHFDPMTGALATRQTEFAVDDPTGKTTGATLEWWARDEQAKARAYLEGLPVLPAGLVVEVLTDKLGPFAGAYWWAKSPSFDMVILEDLGVRTATRMPWHFRNLRDVRTLMHVSGLDYDDGFDWSPASAPAHSPLADCEMQARHVGQAMRALRVGQAMRPIRG